ncbi:MULTISPECIES: acyl carrier protein [Paenibacillus]|uniref:Carrier domain-containing protein n=1 Tax=Paenibacillus borealis TaxID=160799 RepID=A0ABX3H3Q2_PAEBO|nr:acyl carrier protein [Paenibacillus borealis]OMD45059.1 hypothetical protein BSK56_20930 [Paenibacillus borealis]
MDRVQILDVIRDIVAYELKLVAHPQEIQEESDLLADYSIDSIKIIQLIVEIETAFDFEIDTAMLSTETITRISELITYVGRQLLHADGD